MPAVGPQLRGEAGIHGVPGLCTALAEASGARHARRDRLRGCQVVRPGPRYVYLGLAEDLRHVGEVVGLPVHRDGEQRASAELVAETAGPSAAPDQPLEEVA